ncbi:hypothetical protein P4O66_022193, partial [Electrophorus voltai]
MAALTHTVFASAAHMTKSHRCLRHLRLVYSSQLRLYVYTNAHSQRQVRRYRLYGYTNAHSQRQVDYAQEAVQKSSAALSSGTLTKARAPCDKGLPTLKWDVGYGRRTSGHEADTSLSLRLRRNPQPCSRTTRKICALDENVFMAFAGKRFHPPFIWGFSPVMAQRPEWSVSHRLTVDDPVTVEYITCYVSSLKQHYTQSNGRRPFGISTLIVGFDDDGTPNLYQIDPSGTYHAWK